MLRMTRTLCSFKFLPFREGKGLTLNVLMDVSFLVDSINLGWSIVYIEGSKFIISE